MKTNWTPAQDRAIHANGGSLLISAAAGSGKTSVLVERIIQKITGGESPSSIDRILAVTFTNAAAAETKERILLSLQELSRKHPDDQNLIKQQLLLQSAPVSTIHAFCLDLIRQNFQSLGLSPDFRVSDEGEADVIKELAMTRLLQNKYEEKSERFIRVCDIFCNKSDRPLINVLLKIYSFTRPLPFPEEWLNGILTETAQNCPIGETKAGGSVLLYAKQLCEFLKLDLQRHMLRAQADAQLEEAYLPALRQLYSFIEKLENAAIDRDYESCRKMVLAFESPKLSALKNFSDEDLKKSIQNSKNEISKNISKRLKEYFCADNKQNMEDNAAVLPVLSELFELVSQFESGYKAVQKEKNLIDFSDIEHYALKLLVSLKDSGEEFSVQKTPLCLEISEQFDEIMIDEYQDTNQAQDMIFTALSKDTENLFLVGDIKQSIYRFRHAMPEIFLKKMTGLNEFERTFPAKITLKHNFRSRAELTEIINFIFRQIMSETVGEMVYNQEHELVAGADYPEALGPALELHWIEKDGEQEISEPEHAAQVISDMLKDGFCVKDGGEQRACKPRDFCILLRNKTAMQKYVQALQVRGIPCWSDIGKGYFKAQEVTVLLNLLRVIDNPLLDIPLLSVLTSPVFGFNPDELAEIRKDSKKESLYQSLLLSSCDKALSFLKQFDTLREKAVILTADRLINEIFEQLDFDLIWQIMDHGDMRVANLRMLSRLALDYEKAGYKGVGGFIDFIDRQIARGVDMAPAGILSEQADVIRIMTIHHAKGLEFPIVFLCDTAHKFNTDDLTQPVLCNHRLGIAIKRIEPENFKSMTTLAYQGTKLEIERAQKSEEMRLLYVALTRAKEKLVVTARGSSLKEVAERFSMYTEPQAIQAAVYHTNSFADWILLGIITHPDFNLSTRLNGTLIEVKKVDSSKYENESIAEKTGKERAKPDVKIILKLKETLEKKYPHIAQTTLPARVSVSELVHDGQSEIRLKVPVFAVDANNETETAAAFRGTAAHAFLQYADFALARENLEREIQRLCKQSCLTEKQASVISRSALESFLNSNLMTRMLNSSAVYREFRFTYHIFAEQNPEGLVVVSNEADAERILLQGMADCIFEENGSMVLVDYKTDRVNDEQTLLERYKKQLELYADAVAESFGLPVLEKIIYSLHLKKKIHVFKKTLDKN